MRTKIKAGPRPDREAMLIRKAQKGCIKSRNELILMHYGWIWKVTRRSIRPDQVVEEWISYAIERFCNAIRCWKPDGGSNLTTFAAYAMKHILWRHASDDKLIHVPPRSEGKRTEAFLANKAASRKIVRIGMPRERTRGREEVLAVADARVEDPADGADRLLRLASVQAAMATLSPRDRKVVLLRMQGVTLEETGRRTGITKERARQVQVASLAKLRELCGVVDQAASKGTGAADAA